MKMAQGDLDVEPVSILSKDEIGVLADSFSIMIANIRKYVHDLEKQSRD
jgi:methyl-accepting chemotaxis protein